MTVLRGVPVESAKPNLWKTGKLEAEAGIIGLGNEPVGNVDDVPPYHERHHLITAPDGPFGARDSVAWKEAAAA